MTHPSRAKAKTEMMQELERLQDDLETAWLDQSLPDDWGGMDSHHPLERHKTRVTIRLDADMVRWFRKLGPGYGGRLNRVLRVYWMGLMSGHIQAYDGDDRLQRIKTQAYRVMDADKARRGD